MLINIPSLDLVDKAAGEIVRIITRRGVSVVAFYGAMGVGKTTLIKAICAAMGVRDIVTSPTFAILNEYTDLRGRSVYHFDFYRIKNIEEVYDIGFDDYARGDGLCLIEWPQVAEPLLPDGTLSLLMTADADGRRAVTVLERAVK